MKKIHTPDEQRGIVKNPTSVAYEADRLNRARLGHRDVPPKAPPKELPKKSD